MRNMQRILARKTTGSDAGTRLMWEDDSGQDLRKISYESRGWINLAQNTDLWRVLVKKEKLINFLTI
jgi:hypothetical protein